MEKAIVDTRSSPSGTMVSFDVLLEGNYADVKDPVDRTIIEAG